MLALFLRARRTSTHRWRSLACDLGLLVTIAAVALLTCFVLFNGQALIEQIVGTELRSQQYYSLRGVNTLRDFKTHLLDAGWPYWALITLAVWGGLSLRTTRYKDETLVIFAMLLCTVGVLATRVPLRRRYLLLLSVSLSVLGGAAVDGLIHHLHGVDARSLWKFLPLSLSAGLVAFALAGVGWRINHLLSPGHPEDRLGEDAVQFIAQNTSPQAYIICDEGMITFRSGRRTPPSLSVISGRRIKTGGLTTEELITITEVYRPEAVVFWEHKLSTLPEHVAWVKAHYHPARVYDDRHQIFLLEAPQGEQR